MSLITLRDATTDELRAYAAARRYTVETCGIVVDGVAVATDRESQSMLTGAAAYVAAAGGEVTVRWKSSTGWVDLSAAQVMAVATAVGAHVQSAFAAEAAVDAAIAAGTITTLAEIDAAAWPSNGSA